jgi:hypothetical protein
MRGCFIAIPALLVMADAASAGPQQLDEIQLGSVAAGQDLGPSAWPSLLSQPASPTDGSSPAGLAGSSTISLQQPASPGEATTSPFQSTTTQILTSTSSNINHADSSGLPGVIANGWATSVVSGTIGSAPLGQ